MNFFEKILYFFNELRMTTPETWGWYHLLWIAIVIIGIILTIVFRKKYNEKMLKTVLLSYGFISLILEVTKQIMWAFEYKDGIVSWEYSWYSAPFQLCTTPMFVAIIAGFLKKGKLRDTLLSYLCFITIFSSFSVVVMPDSCFTSQILINIHTMFLHCVAFNVSLFLLISKEITFNRKNWLRAFIVFVIFVLIALVLDVVVYKSGILHGDTFNMFYISPYFESSLPVFVDIQASVPYPIFLLSYIGIIPLISLLVFNFIKFIKKIIKKY